MNIFSFGVQFTDENSCRNHFKAQRDKEGVSCKKCSHTVHYWLANKWSNHGEFKIIVSDLVQNDVSFECNQERFFEQRNTEPIGVKALRASLGDGTQTA